MKRHIVLLGALMLSGGLAGSQAFASPEPQAITQSSGTVSGTLVDEKGEPIIGASIQEIGTTRGCQRSLHA